MAPTASPFTARFAVGLRDADARGLGAFALRTRSANVVEILARAASDGRLDHAGAVAAVSDYSSHRDGAVQPSLRPAWLLEIARVAALALPPIGPDYARAIELYTFVRDRHDAASFNRDSAGIFAQLLLRQGRFDELPSVLAELTMADGIRWAVETDRLNPFSMGRNVGSAIRRPARPAPGRRHSAPCSVTSSPSRSPAGMERRSTGSERAPARRPGAIWSV